MSNIEQAIQKAIEGGYGKGREDFIRKLPEFALSQVWLDPLFWQALGKSLGWDEDISEGNNPEWQAYWHQFIDHLASGKDAESFFAGLLGNK